LGLVVFKFLKTPLLLLELSFLLPASCSLLQFCNVLVLIILVDLQLEKKRGYWKSGRELVRGVGGSKE